VDHIVPKNQGGSDDLSKLQALCFRCNAGGAS
jgi:5-methylcytosine-specific restriction endonuclease McrA